MKGKVVYYVIIIISLLWLCLSGSIMGLSFANPISAELLAPKIIMFFYDFFGVMGGSIVQIVIALGLIGYSMKRLMEEKKKAMADPENQLRWEKRTKKLNFIATLLFASLWIGYAALTLSLYMMGVSGVEDKSPAILTVFYSLFGILGGSIAQILLAAMIIGWSIKYIVKKRD